MSINSIVKYPSFLLAAMVLFQCCSENGGWDTSELEAINSEQSVMRVLTISEKEDSLFLRKNCDNLSTEMLLSEEYARLAGKMISTVSSPEQDGVGIAGPQVGIGRNIVAVQRFDKEGEPFEVYPNIRISALRGETFPGKEGCLSVPDTSGTVLRYRDITITYTSPVSLKDTSEDVTGFTAVIFQHETDHLKGVLYIDSAL